MDLRSMRLSRSAFARSIHSVIRIFATPAPDSSRVSAPNTSPSPGSAKNTRRNWPSSTVPTSGVISISSTWRAFMASITNRTGVMCCESTTTRTSFTTRRSVTTAMVRRPSR
jgi:hypothetical protein